MKATNSVLEKFAEWLAILGGFIVFLLMLMVTIDAIGRKTWAALPGALEFSEAMMVPIVFLPLMFVQMKREHVMVSAVTMALPNRVQCLLDALAALIGALIFGFLTWLAVIKALDATRVWEYRVAMISVPIWPFRWFIPLGAGLMVLQLLVTVADELGRAFGKDEPSMMEAELR